MSSMKNQPLPYWMFFIVGFLIAGYASFIKTTGEGINQQAMNLFVWIGLIFIFIGIIKLAFEFFSKKEEKFAKSLAGINELDVVERQNFKNINRTMKNISQTTSNPNQTMNQTINQYIYCSKCGFRNFSNANFCSKCGSKLR